jgi:pantoate--beta-alanine ligase
MRNDPLVIRAKPSMRDWSRAQRAAYRRIGFIPTMGALHEGHRSLIRAARSECDAVAVSIFVNPTQFAPGEDLDRYPRPFEADCNACRAERVDAVFAPPSDEMYPLGSETFVVQERLTGVLCGASRPTHFRGVLTVVLKLLNICEPDVIYLGRKDFQQSVVLRRMIADLDVPVEVRVCPTVREPDGVARSSRNRHLNDEERRQARCLIEALTACRDRFRAGETDPVVLTEVMSKRSGREPAAPLD